jgi:ribonucleoside-triphosphate reductase
MKKRTRKKRKIRAREARFIDTVKFVDDYLAMQDWRVRENANIAYSFASLFLQAAGETIARYTLSKIYPREIARAHVEGDFHIHDLSWGMVGYCAGWSVKDLLLHGFGGVPARTESSPPKHFSPALLQISNFLGSIQNEWSGAQAINSLDVYLAPFVRKDKLDYKQVKQTIQEFIYNLNISSRWGGQCVSEDTEALTSNGWKKYWEINDDDEIATFNLQTGKIEFIKPERIAVYDYDGYLVQLKNRIQDQLVTPNHRVVRKKFNSDKFELIEAENLFKFKTPVLVPITGFSNSAKRGDDSLIELCAWLATEGSFSENRRRVSIFQSEKNARKCEKIRNSLRKLGFSWDETKRVHGFAKAPVIRFRLSQSSSRKVRQFMSSKEIPKFIQTLSPQQVKLFVDTLAEGDGHMERGRIRIVTKDESTRDAIQALCALCGYGSTNRQKRDGLWEINIIRHEVASITQLKRIPYKGKIWCPTTKNGTFVARRNGKVFITGNTPFTNLTLELRVPKDMEKEPVIVGGKTLDETYADYQPEVELINRAFLEVMLHGDMRGRIFTFPIPTYNITRDFEWNSEVADLLFAATAKFGIPYFQNCIKGGIDPHEVRAMCCRLMLDMKELHRRYGGYFGYADKTGSLGVVTINMPRLGYLSKDERDFFERLERLMELAKQSLEIKRKLVERNMKRGLLPFSARYLGTLRFHFSTIGLVGMHEACLNLLGEGIETKSGKDFSIRVLKFMRERLVEFQNETGNIYNLEATPAEGTSHRLARIDKQKFKDIIASGKKMPYYTNSTFLPVGFTNNLVEALRHQDDLQVLYNGGTVLHAFLGEAVSSAEGCKIIVRKIAENFKLPYYTLTPTFSICMTHGYLSGEHPKCPHCRKPAEVYSRVVGYYRPVRNWHVGKQEEFRERLEYDEKITISSMP